jgi:hypothetical protein
LNALSPEAAEVLGNLEQAVRGEAIALGADRKLVVTSPRPAAGQAGAVTFEVGATHADFVFRMGGATASGSAAVDCHTRHVRMQSVQLTIGQETRRIEANGPGDHWTAPPAGSVQAEIVSVSCPRLPEIILGVPTTNLAPRLPPAP